MINRIAKINNSWLIKIIKNKIQYQLRMNWLNNRKNKLRKKKNINKQLSNLLKKKRKWKNLLYKKKLREKNKELHRNKKRKRKEKRLNKKELRKKWKNKSDWRKNKQREKESLKKKQKKRNKKGKKLKKKENWGKKLRKKKLKEKKQNKWQRRLKKMLKNDTKIWNHKQAKPKLHIKTFKNKLKLQRKLLGKLTLLQSKSSKQLISNKIQLYHRYHHQLRIKQPMSQFQNEKFKYYFI